MVTLAQINQLLQSCDELKNKTDILKASGKWSTAKFIYFPEVSIKKDSLNDYLSQAIQTDRQTLKSFETSKSMALDFLQKKKYSAAASKLQELMQELTVEHSFLLDTFNSTQLTKKPTVTSSDLQEFGNVVHDLCCAELAFRFNISAYHYLLTTILSTAKEFLTSEEKIQHIDLDSLYADVSNKFETLKEVLAEYEEVKIIVRGHLDDVKKDLPPQKSGTLNESRKPVNEGKKKLRNSIKRASTRSLTYGVRYDDPREETSSDSLSDEEANKETPATNPESNLPEPHQTDTTSENRNLKRTEFELALGILKDKLDKLSKKGETDKDYKKAKAAAMNLLVALTQAHKNYFIDKNSDLATFKKDCIDAIKPAREELANHRGWSEFLLNLTHVVLSIATFGLVNVASVLATGRYRFIPTVKTDSEQKLDEFATVVNSL